MTYLDSESVFFKQHSKFGDNKDDAATVASSAIENASVYTGAHTSILSRKADELAQKLLTEK